MDDADDADLIGLTTNSTEDFLMQMWTSEFTNDHWSNNPSMSSNPATYEIKTRLIGFQVKYGKADSSLGYDTIRAIAPITDATRCEEAEVIEVEDPDDPDFTMGEYVLFIGADSITLILKLET